MDYFILLLLAFLSFLLIIVVLLQRGRGGGLAGALGGAGGQSAFGTKAGDVFTKITVGLAIIWVLVAGIGIRVLSSTTGSSYEGGSEVPAILTKPEAEEGDQAPNDRPPVNTESEGLMPPTEDASKTPGSKNAPEGKKQEQAVKKSAATEAKKPEAKKSEPQKTETSKTEPVKVEPKKAKPAKSKSTEAKTEKPAATEK